MAKKRERNKKTDVAPETVDEEQTEKRRSPTTIACIGCAAAFVVTVIVAIIAITAWDARDGRLYDGEPLPENMAYIGRWVSDEAVSVRIDTFAAAGDKLACDFAVRNDTKQDMTVRAIGRAIIGQPAESLLVLSTVPLDVAAGDDPMGVTDDENIMVMLADMNGQLMAITQPSSEEVPPAPEPFILKPRELRRFRYRPEAKVEVQGIMGRQILPITDPWALRIAVALDDGGEPRPFYFLRKSAGIGGWFEKGVETAVKGTR